VRVLTDKGDELRSPRVVISTAEDWIRAENVQVVGKRRENSGAEEGAEPDEPPVEEQEQAGEETPPEPDGDEAEG
jgi:hypothetical protein